MSKRNLIIISKIILFYSIFFILMKVYVVLQGAWLLPNLILSLPFILFTVLGIFMLKYHKYYWAYVFAGAVTIGVVRYYEADWALQLQQYFS